MYILYRATEKIFMFVYIILVAWKILCVMFCFEQREGEREREREREREGRERERGMRERETQLSAIHSCSTRTQTSSLTSFFLKRGPGKG